MRPSKLGESDIVTRLLNLNDWQRDGATIRKEFVRASFPAAIAFVVQIGFLAERADHHPDMTVKYRHVTISLTTHDASGLTELDFDLAEAIEKVATL